MKTKTHTQNSLCYLESLSYPYRGALKFRIWVGGRRKHNVSNNTINNTIQSDETLLDIQ